MSTLTTTLSAYTTPPTNYLGATLFLSYIGAALYLVTSISLGLYKAYTKTLTPPTKDENLAAYRAARARHVKIYAFLASASFAALAYHMLSFLLESYAKWDAGKQQQHPGTEAGAGEGSKLDLSQMTVEKLGQWMLSRALFEDFAKELVRDGAGAVWTQASLLATWFWGVWMAQKARTRAIPLPTLLPFILLSQNLPISLTVSLFLIHLHLSSPDIQDPSSTATAPAPPPASKPKFQASPLLPTLLLNTSLLALPALRAHAYFPSLILLTRGLLLLPYTPLLRLRDADIVKCITVSGGFVVSHWAMLRGSLRVQDVVRALGGADVGREAVRALGWDAVLGGVVYLVLGWGGGV